MTPAESGRRKNVQTVEDVKARIDEIRAVADDYEKAHSMECDLLAEVLFAIANQGAISGGKWAQEMASTARAVYRIPFARYTA